MVDFSVVSWNLLGGQRPALSSVAELMPSAEVVVLQEVQRRQVRQLARSPSRWWSWSFKHAPLVRRPEGHAVLASTAAVWSTTVVLDRRWRWGSWRRRIATVSVHAIEDRLVRVIGVHLGGGADDGRQPDQMARCLRVAPGFALPTVIAGDLNAEVGSPVFDVLEHHGFRTEMTAGDVPATNWPPGPRHGPPTKAIDHVLAGPGVEVQELLVAGSSSVQLERLRSISDHLPVLARLTLE